MNQELLDEVSLEKQCQKYFALKLDVNEIILKAVPTSASSRATMFKASNQLYLYITSQGVQLLDDVQKIVRRMQCEAEIFYPLHGEADYFNRIAREKFKIMFPGKPIMSEDDLRYYKNIAPYSPALVLINKVKGEVRGYDSRSKLWRKVKDFSYSKISTKHS